MTLIQRATQVTKAVKNVGRMREIVGAMTRFGFGALVDRLGLRRFRPERADSTKARHEPLPVRLRMLFEELGPAFIKVGQVLAGRPDLIPADIVREFSKLQDKAPVVSFNLLKPALEAELERPLEACFSSFDTEPLAAASIAQVHAARTLDGDDVVVKLQKPGVQKLLTQDLEILQMLAQLGERYVPELRPFRPSMIVEEFRRTLLQEIDFVREANNIKRYRENFADNDFLVIPKVYTDLSSERVLTLQRLRGAKLSDIEAVQAMGIDPRELLRKGIDCFYKSIMVFGFFHGDPHAGNILVLPDGRMGLIDFGSVGWLSQKSKDAVINMFLALVAEDYDALVSEYLQLSPASTGSRSTDKIEAIQAEVSTLFAPYHGLPLKDIPAGKVLMDATGVAFRHQVVLPRDLVLVFKVIMTLEGIGRSLDPDFDLLGAASRFSSTVLKDRYNPARLIKDLVFVGRDTARFLQTAPRQLSETLRQIECGDLRVNVRLVGLDKMTRAQSQGSSRVAFAILCVGLLFTAAYLTASRVLIVHVEVGMWVVVLTFTAWGFLRSFRA